MVKPDRKTRIVATLGPACSSPKMVRRLIKAGVDVFRLNFSHGDHDFHAELSRTVRAVSADLEYPVALLQDLSGPKMRVGRVADDAIGMRIGTEVEVVEGHGLGEPGRIWIEAAGAMERVERGATIRLADGLLELRVVARLPNGVRCTVIHGGLLRSRQGVHIPGADLGVRALTRKDKQDLAFGLQLGVDAVALSFVQDAEDVMALRRLLKKHDARPFVVAKIERKAAMRNLSDILDVASGVMVARGDLGVEIGVEKVPLAQKRIIRMARDKRRPVITATQMLDSMIERPTPTRAEVSDIANAVLDCTDALMLSGETAIGKFPVEAVRTLVSVSKEAEGEVAHDFLCDEGHASPADDSAQAVTRAARVAARAADARAVVGFTNSGRTARLIASQRPARPIYGFTYDEATYRRMRFFWGVRPMMFERASTVSAMIRSAETKLAKKRLVRKDDTIVIVCGQRVATGATNSIHIRTVGEKHGSPP